MDVKEKVKHITKSHYLGIKANFKALSVSKPFS
jgi:hypothetical protein